jgi:ferredoxin-nitrite reductase
MGFNVVLGGYFSIKRAAEAIDMGIWVPPSQVVNLSKSILTLFRDFGARGDRQKARLMWLIEDMGLEPFKAKVLEEMNKLDPSFKFETSQVHKEAWSHGHRNLIGVHPQKQEGKSWVGIHVPVGRLSADECETIAALADKYSAGEIRLTVEQNVILPNVDNAQLASLLAEPALNHGSRLSVNPGHIVGNVISCTGSQFCPLAMVETKKSIDSIARKLQEVVDVPSEVRIHMTGCPNSCGQVQVADIGLMGAPAKKADATGAMKAVSGVNIFVGGKIGEEAHLSTEPMTKGVPLTEEDLVPILAKLIVERHGGKMR